MIMSIVGVILGAVIAILTTTTVEKLRKPKLSIQIATPGDREYKGRPARNARFLYVQVSNQSLPKWARWMTRNSAISCHGVITFYNLDGQNVFGRSMPVRWSGSPEPSPIIIRLTDQVLSLYDPSKITARIDIQPDESEPLDIAAKFDDEDYCYGWSNENYFSDPVWRNPDWKLPSGRYLVKVSITSSGEKVSKVFRLINDVSRTDFRLEARLPKDPI